MAELLEEEERHHLLGKVGGAAHLSMYSMKDISWVCYLAHRKCLQMSLDANVPVSPCCCVFVWFVLSFLIVPALAAHAPAITFTALLASDNLPPRPAEPLSDTHAALFAYAFHLEILILAIRQTGRKRNYGAGSCFVAARRGARARVRHVCVR